jgi:hypothetical protein
LRRSFAHSRAGITQLHFAVVAADMADYSAMNTVYVEFFPVDPLARPTLAVSALPKANSSGGNQVYRDDPPSLT